LQKPCIIVTHQRHKISVEELEENMKDTYMLMTMQDVPEKT
jgi:hypothetical protein